MTAQVQNKDSFTLTKLPCPICYRRVGTPSQRAVGCIAQKALSLQVQGWPPVCGCGSSRRWRQGPRREGICRVDIVMGHSYSWTTTMMVKWSSVYILKWSSRLQRDWLGQRSHGDTSCYCVHVPIIKWGLGLEHLQKESADNRKCYRLGKRGDCL